MANTPKVSVIIPVYNVEKYLEECLDSVVGQTLEDIEIICVDDGSTDSSLSILREYEKKDSRISVFTQVNQGAGAARNKGLEVARGEFLAFLDSDDFFDIRMFEKCCKKLEEDQSDIVVFSAKQYDVRNGKEMPMPWSLRLVYCPDFSPFSASDMSQYIFNAFQNWPWNKMFRHTLIKNNNLKFQEIKRTNDMVFVCMALVFAEKISIIDEPLTTYRVGTGTSLQATNNLAPLAFWEAYIEMKQRLLAAGLYKKYEQSLLNCILGGSLYNLQSVKGQAAYKDIYTLLKNHANKEFKFLDHEKRYYYDEKWYLDFKAICSTSKLYKIGRFISWLPRKVYGGIRCYKEHGFNYTIHQVMQHFNIKK